MAKVCCVYQAKYDWISKQNVGQSAARAGLSVWPMADCNQSINHWELRTRATSWIGFATVQTTPVCHDLIVRPYIWIANELQSGGNRERVTPLGPSSPVIFLLVDYGHNRWSRDHLDRRNHLAGKTAIHFSIWPSKAQWNLIGIPLNILLAAELSPHRPGSTETMNDVWCRSLSQPMAHLHMLLLVHVPPTTMINTNRSSAAGLSLSSIRQMSQRLRGGEGGGPPFGFLFRQTNQQVTSAVNSSTRLSLGFQQLQPLTKATTVTAGRRRLLLTTLIVDGKMIDPRPAQRRSDHLKKKKPKIVGCRPCSRWPSRFIYLEPLWGLSAARTASFNCGHVLLFRHFLWNWLCCRRPCVTCQTLMNLAFH